VFLGKTFKELAALGCLGLVLNGLSACSEAEAVNGEKPDDPGLKIDSTVVVDPISGDSILKLDTLKPNIDSIRVIDPVTGDTVYKKDTIYVSSDSTLRWVGNSSLLITEVSPVNLDWLDEEGGDPGWVEIYNAGSEAANLKGYSLVENLNHGRKWIFGDVKIESKGFLVVFCDKKNLAESPADTELGHGRPHTNWKLEKDGGTLYLIDPFFGIRDSVSYPELSGGVSWGIVDGGAWKYFAKPTPEQPNNKETAYDGFAPTFTFNGSQGGFYNEAIKLNPPSTSDGLTVRCTQDGSEPTKNSAEFKDPINVDHTMVLRCGAFKEGLLTKDIVTNTYFIGESVSMPVVAVSVNPSFFTKHYIRPKAGSTNGDKPDAAPAGLYEDVEFPVHVEYFENGSSTKEKTFEINAGISLMGGYSRLERKKSVAIAIREEYQNGWLHYSLFETRKSDKDKYKGFNLRNNGNRFVSDYFEDALGGAILEGSGVDYQRSRQVVVFYNGEYFGIHDMRERYNKNYVESNYGIDAASVNIIKHLSQTITASNGTTYDYQALLSFVASADNDFSGEANGNYAAVKTLMDVGNYADYMIAEMYMHNGDWPNNNVRAWKSPEQPWKFMIYDLDHGFDWEWAVGTFSQSTNMFDWVKQGGRAESSNKCYNKANELCFHTLYVKLIKNPDFKRLFVNHAAVMLQNYLNAEVVEKVRAKMAATIVSSESERDLKENGQKDRYYNGGFSVSNSSLTEWAESRDTKFASELKSEFGLSGQISMTISANGSGSVLMEGMTLPGNGTYQGKFFGGVNMELTAVPSNGAVFAGWSDGSTENPHIITPTDGMTITANFK